MGRNDGRRKGGGGQDDNGSEVGKGRWKEQLAD